MKICTTDGCSEKHHARGLCRSHYERERSRTERRKCTIKGCTRKHHSGGLCGTHYERKRKHGSPHIVLKSGRRARKCSVDGCKRRHVGRGYCQKHYYRVRKHGTPELPPKKLCSIEGCDDHHSARGWCKFHYASWKRYRDPLKAKTGMSRNKHGHRWTLDELLAETTPGNEGCMEWRHGKLSKEGYGRTSHDGERITTHRLSMLLSHGSLSDGDKNLVLHKCDNPKCINPSHLRLGTYRENMADLIARRKDRERAD